MTFNTQSTITHKCQIKNKKFQPISQYYLHLILCLSPEPSFLPEDWQILYHLVQPLGEREGQESQAEEGVEEMVLGVGVGEEQQQLLVLQASPTRKKK